MCICGCGVGGALRAQTRAPPPMLLGGEGFSGLCPGPMGMSPVGQVHVGGGQCGPKEPWNDPKSLGPSHLRPLSPASGGAWRWLICTVVLCRQCWASGFHGALFPALMGATDNQMNKKALLKQAITHVNLRDGVQGPCPAGGGPAGDRPGVDG